MRSDVWGCVDGPCSPQGPWLRVREVAALSCELYTLHASHWNDGVVVGSNGMHAKGHIHMGRDIVVVVGDRDSVSRRGQHHHRQGCVYRHLNGLAAGRMSKVVGVQGYPTPHLLSQDGACCVQ